PEAGGGLLLLGADVTSRRAGERSGRRNAVEHVLTALDEIHDAFVIYDRDGRLVVCNRRFRELYDYTEDEARPGVHFRELGEIDVRRGNVIVGDGEGMDGYLERKAEYRCRLTGTFDVLLKDGRWIQTRDRRMPDGGFVSIQTDVTESRRAEAALKAAKDAAESALREVEAANAQLGQFAYVASHDLREPLRMVISYLDLLQRRHGAQLAPEAVEFMTHARDGAQRMNQLLLDLLAYSRVGRGEEGPAEVAVAQVLRAVAANLELALRESGGTLVLPEAVPVVVGARPELVSLFQNLIGNALKYRHPDRPPRVEVTAEADPAAGRAVFRVADNGIGIEPRFHERIFQIFQRLHPRGRYEGTGIGLALCRRIVEHHGGTIRVESEPGVGSTFTVTLPLAGPRVRRSAADELLGG
ncbi:MAG: PAS-domain containing protein, partial [Caenispirillum bisanense]|nr:PAS-domain containing protein [Caenispirillum bisanense]